MATDDKDKAARLKAEIERLEKQAKAGASDLQALPKAGAKTSLDGLALESLPPRPGEGEGVIGEALAIVRVGNKFRLIGVKITPETPHRIIKEVASDSGIVASGVMIQEIKSRMMRVGLLKAARVEDMNIVAMPEKRK